MVLITSVLKTSQPRHIAYHYLYLITKKTVYINIAIQIVQKVAIIIMLLTSYLKIIDRPIFATSINLIKKT